MPFMRYLLGVRAGAVLLGLGLCALSASGRPAFAQGSTPQPATPTSTAPAPTAPAAVATATAPAAVSTPRAGTVEAAPVVVVGYTDGARGVDYLIAAILAFGLTALVLIQLMALLVRRA